jgi:hypothetical protein
MSNLDVFAYELNASPDRKVELPVPVSGLDQLGSGAKTSGHSDYCANLRGLGKRVGRSIVTVAQQIREDWPFQELGMIATDFVLALLYALDNEVRSHWPSARGIYVYRSEFFVNQFVPSFLNEGESWTHEEVDLFPQIFRDPENAGKRIFSQIQRLAAFGLILTRSNSSINRRPRGGESGATRFGVHSTREEIRINTWGRCYVENEVAAEHIEGIRRIVACRQKEMRTAQHRLSTLYMQFDAPPSPMTLSDLGRIERQRLKLAQAIHDGRGCALTFSHAEGSGAMRRRAT